MQATHKDTINMKIDTLKDLAEQAKNDDLIYPDKRFPPSRYYRFLMLLAEYMKPTLSVELGVCGGGGSLHLAKGFPGGDVVGVDFQFDHKANIEYIMSNFKNFHFMFNDSVKSAKNIVLEWGKVDILFIDTDHTYDRTLAEYKAWKPYMKKGGVICFDDLFRHGTGEVKSMRDAWDKIEGKKVRLDHLHDGTYPTGGGFGCLLV